MIKAFGPFMMKVMASRIRALPVGTGAVARPLPVPLVPVTSGPVKFPAKVIRGVVRDIPVSGSRVPGVRGGLFRHNGNWILRYRKVLQEKMSQGIPYYMAQKYAEDEARKVN